MRRETEADRINQELVLQVLDRSWGTTHSTLPTGSTWDATLVNGDGQNIAIVEVKCRTWDRFHDTLHIRAQKVDAMRREADRRGIAPVLALRITFSDGSMWYGWASLRGTFPAKVGGRTDRGEVNDVERLYDIPISQFTTMEEPCLNSG